MVWTDAEIPGAALTATDKFVVEAALFSPGFNYFTHTTKGLNRDDLVRFSKDAEHKKAPRAIPFMRPAQGTVGEFVAMAVEKDPVTRSKLAVGIGGGPCSVEFCHHDGAHCGHRLTINQSLMRRAMMRV
jgi:phosphoenolpyruvate synthase/pyruvate phosphate dikinase